MVVSVEIEVEENNSINQLKAWGRQAYINVW